MYVSLRRARIDDAKEISALIIKLTEKHIIPTCETFAHQSLLSSMSEDKIKEYISSNFSYFIAKNASENIVGVIGIQGNSHIYHLFVDESYQGHGLSRQLWSMAKDDSSKHGNKGLFTVNSAINAESIYLKFGFKRIDGKRNRGGIIDIPMELRI